MIRRLPLLPLLLATATGAHAAAPVCEFQQVPVGTQQIGHWIDRSNWLATANQRLSLQAGEVFMPSWRLPSPGNAAPAPTGQRPVDDFPTIDPLDGRPRSLGFLLDSRVYADGLVVMRNGRVVAERYRNGLVPDKPRLLLDATRPLLNLLGAMGIHQGKLAPDKSVGRVLSTLSASSGLRKMSIRRLLESEVRHSWSAEEVDSWRQAAGWTTGPGDEDIRTWLARPGRWDKPVNELSGPAFEASPDDDLLAWVLAESSAMPLSRLFCEQLLARTRPEHDVLWLSDPQGTELAAGLGLSLRDFAKLGQLLVDARSNRNRGKVPAWFIETLTATSGARSPEIKGLAAGSEQRYGFVHLGGSANRIALIGSHGTSLYVDFDRRLVIALYATYPKPSTPGLLATLEQVWKAAEQATSVPEKRRKP